MTKVIFAEQSQRSLTRATNRK